MTKPKTIVVKWSKRENDILYSWGDGIPKCDTSLIHSTLDYDFGREDNNFHHGLMAELEKRGYDLTTFKLTIKKKEVSGNSSHP